MIWDLLLKVDPEGPTLIAATACADRFSDYFDHPFRVLLQHTVVRVDAFGCEDMAPDRVDQRHQGYRGGTYPVRERRYVEIDAFTLVDVALTMKRQVQAVLGAPSKLLIFLDVTVIPAPFFPVFGAARRYGLCVRGSSQWNRVSRGACLSSRSCSQPQSRRLSPLAAQLLFGKHRARRASADRCAPNARSHVRTGVGCANSLGCTMRYRAGTETSASPYSSEQAIWRRIALLSALRLHNCLRRLDHFSKTAANEMARKRNEGRGPSQFGRKRNMQLRDAVMTWLA